MMNAENHTILKCEIPMTPPSVNHYWGLAVEKGKVKKFVETDGLNFRKVVALFVKNKLSDKRLKIEIEFCFTDRRRRDIDNYLKALLDALVKAGLCHDDEQFDVIQVRRGEVVKGGLTRVVVYELVEI